MHAGNRLHDASVTHAQAVPIDGLHAPDVGAAELRQRNARVAVDRAGHAGRPQQLVIQVAIHELVDIAQILQQLPGLAERRRDQLDQRLGKIRRDVFIGQRRARARPDAGSARWRPSGDTRSDSFSTPLRPPRNTPRSPELISPARRRSNFLSTTLRNTLIPSSFFTAARRRLRFARGIPDPPNAAPAPRRWSAAVPCCSTRSANPRLSAVHPCLVV